MSVVTLQMARDHIEVIGTGQDAKIQQYINAAEAYASQYMNRPLQPWEPASSESSEVPVPADVIQAILLLVGDFFENREASIVGTIHAENPAATALLHFHRKGLGV